MTGIPQRVNLLLPATIWLNCTSNCQSKLATKTCFWWEVLSDHSDGKVLVCRCQVRHESGRCSTQGRRTLDTRCLGEALAKVRGRVLDWGWIVVLLSEFSLENCYFTVLWRDFSGGTIHGSECWRNRPGFGWHAVYQKLSAIQYYRVQTL